MVTNGPAVHLDEVLDEDLFPLIVAPTCQGDDALRFLWHSGAPVDRRRRQVLICHAPITAVGLPLVLQARQSAREDRSRSVYQPEVDEPLDLLFHGWRQGAECLVARLRGLEQDDGIEPPALAPFTTGRR